MSDDLALRAEQAFTGSLLARPHLTADLPELRVTDFTDPACRAIYQAILLARATSPQIAADPGRLAAHIAATTGDPQIDQAHLARLAADSPYRGTEAASYARMITEAAVLRDLDAHARRLATAGSPADRELGRRLRDAGPGHRAFPQPAGRPAATREHYVLAALIQHPAQITEVATWLSPDVFTAGMPREIYQTICDTARYGDPVDTFTIVWTMAERRDPAIYATTAWDTISTYMQTSIDIHHTRPGDAITAARDLLASHVRDSLEQAAAQPGPAPGAQHTPGHQQAVPPPPVPQPETGGPQPQL